MNIALIAHDNKKELMIDLCIAYKSILQKHTCFPRERRRRSFQRVQGCRCTAFSRVLGGTQQIAARVSLNEIDMVIFLREPAEGRSYEPDMQSLLRLCDMNNVPFATNIATAEMLIKGLERGDLQWREYIR